MSINRRDFLHKTCKWGIALGACSMFPPSFNIASASVEVKEASYYRNIDGETTLCLLCPNACVRKNKGRSKCLVRENRKGKYYTLVYNNPCVIHLDPVEKAPFYHFMPGISTLSIATAGCNLKCKYCQNWQFSQKRPEETKNFTLTPSEVVRKAREAKCRAISYFYTEPTVYFEYMVDICREAKKAGLRNVMVTAGYINSDPLIELCGYIDAFAMGLKGFNEVYYQEIIGGSLSPVLSAMQLLHEKGAWFEIVTLIVPTLNDNPVEIEKMAAWIKRELSDEIPLHFLRFVPEYLLKSIPPTPIKTLENARKIARSAGLKYVYIGNLPGHEAANTVCPECKKTLISRVGFTLIRNELKKGKCPECGYEIPGRWNI